MAISLRIYPIFRQTYVINTEKSLSIMKFPAITVGLQVFSAMETNKQIGPRSRRAHSKLHCPDVAGACGAHCGCLGFQLKTTKRFQHVCWNHNESNSQRNHWWQIAVIMPAQHNQQTSSTFAWKHILSLIRQFNWTQQGVVDISSIISSSISQKERSNTDNISRERLFTGRLSEESNLCFIPVEWERYPICQGLPFAYQAFMGKSLN